MRLGQASMLQVSTGDLVESLEFYLELGFRVLTDGTEPEPWAQITDGSMLLLLSQNSQPEWSLTYFNKEASKVPAFLEQEGIKPVEALFHGKELLRVSFNAPGELIIRVVNLDPATLYQPRAKTLREMSEDELRATENYPNHIIGIFGELTLPVKSLEEALSFWLKLDFEKLISNEEPYPWSIITDDKNIIGLHQTKEYEHPALTYFAADMSHRIHKMVQHKIKGVKVLGTDPSDPQNAMVKSPEGMTFFLFSF